MGKVDELVFIHQVSTPCNLAILAESIGLKTRVIKQVYELDPASVRNSFYLIAQEGAALDNRGIPLLAIRLVPHVPVALYQVNRNTLDPSSALLLGIRGLLYSDQRMDLMLTGLRKMVADELWYDRTLISKMFRKLVERLETSDEYSQNAEDILQILTKRERTIIRLVSSGARNREIADDLCISEHTVKAHISSIFRKTHSRNRVELLRWAQNYAEHLALSS
ncbi:response regulator transcription factor [Shewanella sp. D64]|uniref:helix-turn-helix transcriptional regulator n=1 Tax=unclassified Shewanella TaxID=196818 RepID=UPI0022BA386B|nr:MULTISPECIES: response regulator transcription factor [unclassified Shewanella]MEC4724504.1 response regulator transcription factor [Shewanella sp. D64]MEC4736719.1 response regulator transcription factor [Shewanella sp. E94]WBJ94612.1 response regulator transcription factor [Shewanella sp. MTB7]